MFRYANAYPHAIELLTKQSPSMPDLGKLITQRSKGLENFERAFQTAGRSVDEEGNMVLKDELKPDNEKRWFGRQFLTPRPRI